MTAKSCKSSSNFCYCVSERSTPVFFPCAFTTHCAGGLVFLMTSFQSTQRRHPLTMLQPNSMHVRLRQALSHSAGQEPAEVWVGKAPPAVYSGVPLLSGRGRSHLNHS